MMIYLLVDQDGRLERIEAEKPMELKPMQKLVGGYIEYVRMGDNGLGCIVNEDGRICDPPLPDNARYPNLAGPIVFGRMVEGADGMDLVGLSPEQLADAKITNKRRDEMGLALRDVWK
jgi:hypothetical protein